MALLSASCVTVPKEHRMDKMTQEPPFFCFSLLESWSHVAQAGWPHTHNVSMAGFELLFLLSQLGSQAFDSMVSCLRIPFY